MAENSSDSEGPIAQVSSRRKSRITSDSDSSDDSFDVHKKKRKKVKIESSSDSGSDLDLAKRRKRADGKPVIASDSESDTSSIGDGCGCPICLGKFYDSTLKGKPNGCEHVFCIDCIIAWSKTNTTCPLCRSAFENINILLRDELLEEHAVQKAVPNENDIEQFVNDVWCLVCRQSDQEDTLLLCDECDDAYHCACLTPPLRSVPAGQWFCPRCSQADVDSDDNDEEYIDDINENHHIARTSATERVRRQVESRRRTVTPQSTQRRTTTRTRRRGTTLRGSTSTRTRRTTTKSKARRKTGRKTRRKRRKGGRRSAIIRKAYASSVDQQVRIARSLGLSDRVLNRLNRNTVAYHVLAADEPSTSRGVSSSYETFIASRGKAQALPNLHIFGSRDEYVPQEDSDTDQIQTVSVKVATQSPQVAGGDFLAGLLAGQSVLLDKKSELKRDPNGTVRLINPDQEQASVSAQSVGSVRKNSSSEKKPDLKDRSKEPDYDLRYKPPRVSRVDMASLNTYEDTIEEVLAKHCHSSSPRNPDTSKRQRNEKRPTFADEPHNIAKLKEAKEKQGWINSLKLAVPTVMNSLNIFDEPESSADLMSVASTSRDNINSRIKKEPRDCDELRKDHKHKIKTEPNETDPGLHSEKRAESSRTKIRDAKPYRRSRSRSPLVKKERTSSDIKHKTDQKDSRPPHKSDVPAKKDKVVIKKELQEKQSGAPKATDSRRKEVPLEVKIECEFHEVDVTKRERTIVKSDDSEKRSEPCNSSYFERKEGLRLIDVVKAEKEIETERKHKDALRTPPELPNRARETVENNYLDPLIRIKTEPMDMFADDSVYPATSSQNSMQETLIQHTNRSYPLGSDLCYVKEESEQFLTFNGSQKTGKPDQEQPKLLPPRSDEHPTGVKHEPQDVFSRTTEICNQTENQPQAVPLPIAEYPVQVKLEPQSVPISIIELLSRVKQEPQPVPPPIIDIISQMNQVPQPVPPPNDELLAQLKQEPQSNHNSSSHVEGYSSGVDSDDDYSEEEKPPVTKNHKNSSKKEDPPVKHKKYFVDREHFKDEVIKEVGAYLKKFYKRHQISKEDYKEIFKKVLKKVCTKSSSKKQLICTKSIHKLCIVYVRRARDQIKLDCKFEDEPVLESVST